MPRISVVIPIYNVATYLEHCLKTVRAQTFGDIEIICVNDGSTDESPRIIREQAALDERIVVLDKENGGYGHSVNFGIRHATGEFIAIVEPDDFLDPRMYEELLALERYGDGTPADIIKSGYWEYFDSDGELDSMVNTCALINWMGRYPLAFDVKDDPRLLALHPSIWSALYRRSFLIDNGITFHEAPGAGWVDNPFFYEAMLTAHKVVWVPGQYYYYRITNPGASSYLKDYHIPFDRLRESWEVLRTMNLPDAVWAHVYLHAFNDIIAVRESGFAMSDSELYGCIREVLERMDPAIVHEYPVLAPDRIREYDRILSLAPASNGQQPRDLPPVRKSVDLSIVVPVGDDEEYADEALTSLADLKGISKEVLLVGGHSLDLTPLLIDRKVAQEDDFFVLYSEEPLNEAVERAIADARGTFTMVTSLTHELDHATLVTGIEALGAEQADVLMFDPRCVHLNEVLHLSSEITSPIAQPYVSKGLSPQELSSMLFDCCQPSQFAAVFRTSFLKESGLRFYAEDLAGIIGFLGRAALRAERIVYCAGSPFRRYLNTYVSPAPLMLDPRVRAIKELAPTFPAFLRLAQEAADAEPYVRTLRNAAVECFIFDLSQRRSHESMHTYYDTYHPQLEALVAGHTAGCEYSYITGHQLLQLVEARGVDGYIEKRFLEREHDVQRRDHTIYDLQNSAAMRMGTKARALINHLLPRKLVDTVRSAVMR